MKREILKHLETNYSTEPYLVDRLVISVFININKINIASNQILKNLCILPGDTDRINFENFLTYFIKNQSTFSFEDLIELFEFVVSPGDKKVNGAVYTPENIKKFIVENVSKKYRRNIDKALVCDVACGCGGFLFSYAKFLRNQSGQTYKLIYENLIYGIDITDYSVRRSEIILSLLAVLDGEDDNFTFNIKVGNALDFDWLINFPKVGLQGGFDIIIGNPPYVCSKNISNESRTLIDRWSVSKSGNPDLYIPFFQLGYEALREGGVLGYITVNSFIRSVNGRKLRAYFRKNKTDLKIIDFGGEQVFKGRTTYTCICIIHRHICDTVTYIKTASDSIENLKESDFINVAYDHIDDLKGWSLNIGATRAILNNLKTTGRSLNDVVAIRGGIATLKNEIFMFKPVEETDKHYLLIDEGKNQYWIEKEICQDVVKANSLKKESDFDQFVEKIIFPYKKLNNQLNLLINVDLQDNKIELIKEIELIDKFPGAYNYLNAYKNELSKRDKGSGNYKEWYAYGRSQGLTTSGYKLLFPHISNNPYFVLAKKHDILFYSGFALVSNDLRLLKILKKVLESNVFWFYIKNTSKPYSSEYFGLGKNFLKDFSVPSFSLSEENFLLSCKDLTTIDEFLCLKYNISTEAILGNFSFQIENN